MGTHLLASLGSKGKNGDSLACLRNAGSHSAESYCTKEQIMDNQGDFHSIEGSARFVRKPVGLARFVHQFRSANEKIATINCSSPQERGGSFFQNKTCKTSGRIDREALEERSMITMAGADRWSATLQAQKLRLHSCKAHQAQQLGNSAFAGGSADGSCA